LHGYQNFNSIDSKDCLANKENIRQSDPHYKKKRSCSQEESENLTSKMPPTTSTATKLPGRQTNNSLSSITGQIVIQTPSVISSPNSSASSRKKKAKVEV
jgi:hypothetical protein